MRRLTRDDVTKAVGRADEPSPKSLEPVQR